MDKNLTFSYVFVGYRIYSLLLAVIFIFLVYCVLVAKQARSESTLNYSKESIADL